MKEIRSYIARFLAVIGLCTIAYGLFIHSRHENLNNQYQSRELATDDHATDDHAAADDHGSGSSHGTFRVFGGMQYLEPATGAWSFIIIIACILILEHLFHELHATTHDTPFADMVAAIEKELMIVGVMAFVFKCIVASTSFLSPDWFHALEFSDIVVPITSFMFCFQGFILIVMIIRETISWRRAYHLHLFEILDRYYKLISAGADEIDEKDKVSDVEDRPKTPKNADNVHNFTDSSDRASPNGSPNGNQQSHSNTPEVVHNLPVEKNPVKRGYNAVIKFITRWVPFFADPIYSEMEFRILHHIFCTHFEIQHSALQFDEYVRRVCEKYILNIITINPGNWVVIICVGLLNWFRQTYHITAKVSKDCELLHNKSHQTVCYNRVLLEDFFDIGIGMFLITLIVAIVARYYELLLLSKKGCVNDEDYARVLETTENIKIYKKKEKAMFSKDDLKAALSKARENVSQIDEHETPMHMFAKCLWLSVFGVFMKRTSLLEVDHSSGGKSWLSSRLLGSKSKSNSSKVKAEAAARVTEECKRSHDSMERVDSSALHPQVSKLDSVQSVSMKVSVLESGIRDVVMSVVSPTVQAELEDTTKFSNNMPGIFFRENAILFFDIVDHLMMIISFYLSLWLCNYVNLAYRVGSSQAEIAYWQFLTVLPAILSMLAYMACVRSTCLLKAVTVLDLDVVETTIEDAETAAMLSQSVRKKILDRLNVAIDMQEEADGAIANHHTPEPSHHRRHKEWEVENELRLMFAAIDTDGSMTLSRAEFKSFLSELKISFSHRRWRQIFVEVDRNFDDCISFDEMFLFLFPHHNEALARESKRIQLVGDRLEKRRASLGGEHSVLGPSMRRTSQVYIASGSSKIVPIKESEADMA